MNLPFIIALRYLLARKSHQAVNVISMISMAGIAVATVAMVVVMSVFNGFTQLAADRLSHIDPELKVIPLQGKLIEDADSVSALIGSVGGVAHVAPVIEDQALAMYHDRQTPVNIKGVPPHYDGNVVPIGSTVIDGSFAIGDCAWAESSSTPSVISVGVAMQLGARPGFYDPLTIFVPRRRARYNPANPAASFTADTTVVTGVTQVNQSEYDVDYIFVDLDVARDLFEVYDAATAIEVSLTPGAQLDDVHRELTRLLRPTLKVLDRHQQQEQAFRMINIEKWVTLLMLVFILVIASFNIVSTLSMIIIDKRPSLLLLSALGAPRRMLARIFMLQGWMVSLIGGLGGTIIGVILCLAQQWGGFIKIAGNADNLSIDTYPVRVMPVDLLVILLTVALIGLATGFVSTRFLPRRR